MGKSLHTGPDDGVSTITIGSVAAVAAFVALVVIVILAFIVAFVKGRRSKFQVPALPKQP